MYIETENCSMSDVISTRQGALPVSQILLLQYSEYKSYYYPKSFHACILKDYEKDIN
jgi:hypothetical protein